MRNRITVQKLAFALVAAAVAISPVAFAADSSEGGCAGAWLGAVKVNDAAAMVLVSLAPDMDPGETVVALLDVENGPVVAEVEQVTADAKAGIVTIVVAGHSFGAAENVTITLRQPKGELLGCAKTAGGEAIAPLFTVSRIAPELATHLKKAAGLVGVPAGVMEALETMKTGFETKNIDTIMASISDDFRHWQWPNKATYRAFIEGAIAQGELDNAEVDAQYAEFTRNEDGTWTVYPIEVMAMFGSATAELTLREENGVWRIISMDVAGV